MLERVEERAARDGMSRDDVVRHALERYLFRGTATADEITARVNAHLDEHPLTDDELAWVHAASADLGRVIAEDEKR